MPITLDFETRSAADLKKVGAYKYSVHPTTVILCLVAHNEDLSFRVKWALGDELPEELFEMVRSGEIVHAHNAEFEYCIWKNVGVKKYGFPPLPIDQMICDAANAARLAMPRGLEALAKAIEAPVQKDMEGNRLMKRMTRPRKPSKAELQWLDI